MASGYGYSGGKPVYFHPSITSPGSNHWLSPIFESLRPPDTIEDRSFTLFPLLARAARLLRRQHEHGGRLWGQEMRAGVGGLL